MTKQAQKMTDKYDASYYELDGAICNRSFAINDEDNAVEIENPWGDSL